MIIFMFIRESAEARLNYKKIPLNPAQLFIVSFIVIIFGGAFLLTLPGATYQGISFIDALFTSTSAVCVTGLSVVDPGTYFTRFGLTIIMILIQIGGLGILTFASFFTNFFKQGSSYQNQLIFSDITSSKTLEGVFGTIRNIVYITFIIEGIVATIIYYSLNDKLFTSVFDKIYFSVFHSVSAFCNAGFSTLSSQLYDVNYKFNYPLQLAIIFAFVMGGLGFPIISNMVKYTKYKIIYVLGLRKKDKIHRPWLLNLDSRLNIITTSIITFVAFIVFLCLEFYNTLAEHQFFGKLVVALFGATTPRTAGFNNIDMTALALPSIMLILLLMWIGASPQSTGGGIKTSVFAIATLNILSLAKGKSKIEIFRREISDLSVRRSYAVIALSLIAVGFGTILLSFFDPQIGLLKIAFECFSAYGTVGLSLNVTPILSEASKLVIITLMFLGRISMLTLVIAVFNKIKEKNYRYPVEETFIN
jgi:Trk-type K+ transport system membrane component